MTTHVPELASPPRTKPWPSVLLVALALVAFCAVFLLADNAYNRFADARFPAVGESAGLATLWGIVSRAHLLVFLIPLAAWKPRAFGFQLGSIREHRRLLLGMLIANCGIIGAYLLLTGGTPYSGDQWLFTEVVTVPVVEELFWRGLVFAVLHAALSRFLSPGASSGLAVWLSGIAFGLLHANNLFAGVPLQFVAIQVLNAAVWGVVYGYARAKTGSIYPPMLLHAAMNLVVVLF